ncbi:hypothetical protein CYMTET_18669 [Cymbomonas tetramitiformis]|uniref:Serine/threonine-protein phosphatase 2A activator n=1 Tax=Cymbomonas tetramitiformis TaxID=36881 RepID=A0AAE0G8Y5_9CHLO|nr:hypothetical protein CYMTET_18669 [Cymbomonas tetramitiformis]
MASTAKEWEFTMPKKQIRTEKDLQHFLSSDTHNSFVQFIVSLNESVKGKPLGVECLVTERIQSIVDLLGTLSTWVDEIPPATQQMRYGNTAFRTWQERLANSVIDLSSSVLPENLKDATIELAPYLLESFGNGVRIDYGTGHETNFIAWLYCLSCLGVITEADQYAVVSKVFLAYLGLMRKVQTTYWLEPAGSHGVWGLDDYQFIPFIWGSAQLVGHKHITPKSIHNEEVLLGYSGQYLYLGCVSFVKEVKKGPLQETSPMLTDISAVHNWEKVNNGMIKMYKAEVLSKIPIMQHFLFGSILAFS